jgi:hypothetical protein
MPSSPSQALEANDTGNPETQDTEDLETSDGDSDDNLKILENGRELRNHFHQSWQLTSGEGLINRRRRDRPPCSWTSHDDFAKPTHF